MLRRLLVAIAVAAPVAVLTACAGPDPETGRVFVGAVPGTEAYLAVVTGADGAAAGYLCDGEAVGALLSGTVADGAVRLQGARAGGGFELTGRVADDAVTGTVMLDGVPRDFRAEPAVGDAGLYLGTSAGGAGGPWAGWVVLADGSQRGAVSRADGDCTADRCPVRPARPLDPKEKEVDLGLDGDEAEVTEVEDPEQQALQELIEEALRKDGR